VKVVIAFDVDGTIETSSGPVTVARLEELQALGVDVWIVSPSGLSPNRRTTKPTIFPESIAGDRVINLKSVKSTIRADLYFYVSDNKDYDAAKQAGFSYIEAGQFV
jgi:hypothetical protein